MQLGQPQSSVQKNLSVCNSLSSPLPIYPRHFKRVKVFISTHLNFLFYKRIRATSCDLGNLAWLDLDNWILYNLYYFIYIIDIIIIMLYNNYMYTS